MNRILLAFFSFVLMVVLFMGNNSCDTEGVMGIKRIKLSDEYKLYLGTSYITDLGDGCYDAAGMVNCNGRMFLRETYDRLKGKRDDLLQR